MRLRIVRPLPAALEGFDVTNFRFGACYEIPAPLSDLLLITGYGVPPDDQTFEASAAGDDELLRKETGVPKRAKPKRRKRSKN